MATILIDSLGRVYLRGPNGKFAKPKTDEERKIIEELKQRFVKENKSRVSKISHAKSAGKKKLSDKREQFKSAAFHSPKSLAKHESSTTSRKLKISDVIPLTRSKSLAIALDIKFKVLRSKTKSPLNVAKSKTSICSDSLSEVSQNSQVKSVSTSSRSFRSNKCDKKSVSEDQSSQTKSVSDSKRSVRLAAKANLLKTQVKRVQSKTVKRRLNGTKSKSSIHSDSTREETQSTQSNLTYTSKRSVHLNESGKSHRSKKSTKRIRLKAMLLNVSDSESDNERHSPQASSVVTPKRGARLTAKKSSYYSLKFALSLTKVQNDC